MKLEKFKTINIWIVLFLGVFILTGCSTKIQPFRSTKAELPVKSQIIDELRNLPPPTEKIIIAVYKYRDQTGQYKSSSSGVTYSTAVTQGATAMLVKALQDAGAGKWFKVLERESLSNLINERKIIHNTRKKYLARGAKNAPMLPPLLYAPIILDGGIISYETNLITGGLGARYLGIGGSTEYQRDSVTTYLRAISVKNGEILSSVNTSKSIFSVKMDVGVFKFIAFKQLLEVETGFSSNEPPQMAVLEAIEKSVYDLIVEGAINGLWKFKDEKKGQYIIDQYNFLQEDYYSTPFVANDHEVVEPLLSLRKKGYSSHAVIDKLSRA